MNLTTDSPVATPVATPAVPTFAVVRGWLAKNIVDVVVGLLKARFTETHHTQSGNVLSHDANNWVPSTASPEDKAKAVRPEPYPSVAQWLQALGIVRDENEAVDAIYSAIVGSDGRLTFGRDKDGHELGLRLERMGPRMVRTVGVYAPELRPPSTRKPIDADAVAKMRAALGLS